MTRARVAFVAWTSAPERAREIAAALEGPAFTHYPLGHVKPLAPLRYLFSGILTCWFLARHRPRTVIVTNPPIFPGLIALGYAWLAGAQLLLDSHPGGFGLQGDALSRRMQPVVKWVTRRAAATLVTEESLKARVEDWGGRAEIVHEAPPEWEKPRLLPRGARPEVLFICTFNADEPVEVFIKAAEALPQIGFKVTGHARKASPGLFAAAPANVQFVGFLVGGDYTRALASADLVVVLTTEPTSVVKAGYEAVYAERPLLVSDWPAGREAFPHAVYAHNTAASLTREIQLALTRREELLAAAPRARELQERRWVQQLRALERLIGT